MERANMNASHHPTHLHRVVPFAMALTFLKASSSQAVFVPPPPPPQPLFSFETGLEGWEVPGFASRPITLSNSFIGATNGAQSLAITQSGDGYSWVAHRTSFDTAKDDFYNAMNLASLNESAWSLDFDVTFRDADIPDGNFLNVALWINSTNGFRDAQDVARTFTKDDSTVHVSIPLTSFSGSDELATNSFFYEIGIGLNGDWGSSSARVYVDNINLVPEPTGALFGLILMVAALLPRSRTGRVATSDCSSV